MIKCDRDLGSANINTISLENIVRFALIVLAIEVLNMCRYNHLLNHSIMCKVIK